MAYPLSNYLFSLSSFTAERNLSPPLALSLYNFLSVFHSSSPALVLGSFKPSVCSLAQHPKEC